MVCALAKTMQCVCAFQVSVRLKGSAAEVQGIDSPLYELCEATDSEVLFSWFSMCHFQTVCSHLSNSA